MNKKNSISNIIRNRRSIFPKTYSDQPIDKAIIEEILENANWAPNHKHTEPWRFKVFTGKALERVSTFMGEFYKSNTPEEKFSEMKYKKKTKNPLRAACIIAICLQRDPDERVPEWEELAAVACAVQNMWLTASAHGIGAYWSTTGAIKDAHKIMELNEGERCIGFFYMGYPAIDWPQSKRNPIEDKVTWYE